MDFRDIQLMSLPPESTISRADKEEMKAWIANYRPVRQRTVRSENTKDKAGTLPIAIYQHPFVPGSSFDGNEGAEIDAHVSHGIEATEEVNLNESQSSHTPSNETDEAVGQQSEYDTNSGEEIGLEDEFESVKALPQ